ncbi:MAG: cytochrome c [Rhodospirillales bacterium]
MIKHLSIFAAAMIAAATFGTAVPAAADTTQAVQLAAKMKFPPPVAERKKNMKALSSNMKGMKKALGSKDMKAAAKHAAGLVKASGVLSKKADTLFGKETAAVKGTRAKQAIWKDWAKFKAGLDALHKSSVSLASAVKSGGDAAGAFKAVGKTCSSCHKAFRGPKPKKM